MARGALHVSSGRVVIVGGGEGGAEVAACLRKAGYDGPVTIVGEEPQLPYQRPPLSKRFLSGDSARRSCIGHLPRRMTPRISNSSSAHARSRSSVLSNGRSRLRVTPAVRPALLATGGRPRRLTLANVEHAYAAANVHELRTIEDARRLRDRLRSGAQLVVIGGGYIGLEVAATAVRMGAHVTVLEALPVSSPASPPRSCPPSTRKSIARPASTCARTHRWSVSASPPARSTPSMPDGIRIPADAVLVDIGIVPNVELRRGPALPSMMGFSWARTAGRAIRRSSRSAIAPIIPPRTSIAAFGLSLNRARSRRPAALRHYSANRPPHTAIPWFWSDQYDLTLQTVGLGSGHDQLVLRGDPAERSFLAFYLRKGKLIAADAISRPARPYRSAKKKTLVGAFPYWW